jgi:dTDP-4-dehydrorhamnose 3,5-epimerase
LIFSPTPIEGAWLLAPEPRSDARGFLLRTFCTDAFAARGLDPVTAQCSLSYNARRGTLRGMHYQAKPHAETKVIRCGRGVLFDVLIDLRRNSPTFGRHYGVELSRENLLALYVPRGCAHGFQTLADDTDVWYHISAPHHPDSARGVRWNDPAFGIVWPVPNPILHPRDAAYPDFDPRSDGVD